MVKVVLPIVLSKYATFLKSDTLMVLRLLSKAVKI
jgi:hypothetical protein